MFNQLRQQLASFWGHQSNGQRAVLILLIVAAVVLIPLFVTWAGTPSYEVAFSGLSEADAGRIVEQLTSENIPYQLRGSGTILVPHEQVYEVRLRMAKDGLLQGDAVGFELFNSNALGMTEFTQRVNYQRALEGELERTIGSLSAIQAVRVHIVMPEKSLLTEDQAPTTASVTIQESSSEHLDASQVQAITHLVASAVEGLKSENVVVVDVNGNLLANGEVSESASVSSEMDSQRNIELAAARELQRKVQGLLDSALGPNKSVVQASVNMDWTARETTTLSYSPTETAVRSEQTVVEKYTSADGTLAGVPGAESNLPPAATTPTPGATGLNYERNEVTKNYEVTSVEQHEVQAPGQVNRISLSVLVDGVTDEQQLTSLRSVISAAAGIDTNRGDVLAVESLAFDHTYYETQTADLEKGAKTDLYITIGEIVGTVVLLGLLLWYIQKLLSNLRLASSEVWTPILKPAGDVALASGAAQGALSAPQPRYLEHQTPTGNEKGSLLPMVDNTPLAIKMPHKVEIPSISEEEEQLRKYVEQLSEEDPAALAEILQLWLNEDEKHNG